MFIILITATIVFTTVYYHKYDDYTNDNNNRVNDNRC